MVTNKDSLIKRLNLCDSQFKSVKSSNEHTWPKKNQRPLTEDFLLLSTLFFINVDILRRSPALTLRWCSVLP